MSTSTKVWLKRAMFIVIPVVVLLFLLDSCAGDDPQDVIENEGPDLEIVSPANQEMFTIGDQIEVEIKNNKRDELTDLNLFINDKRIQKIEASENPTFSIDTKDLPVGYLPFVVKYRDAAGKDQKKSQTIILFSDIVPEKKKVKIIEQLPHDPTSYTQGFEIVNGVIYESTGQYGTSYIAEVDAKTGAINRKKDLAATFFGEGLTILDSVIYQITWQAGMCKAYDMQFNELGEKSYIGQGWGLTNDGKQIIMSNGSDKIVWRDPKTFEVTREMYVFDDQSSEVNLNELELINGRLFANIYTENDIIEIDTANGKILSRIDCSEIINAQGPAVDYFNGIAYDEQTDQIYVTGKLYPYKYIVTFE